MLNLKKLKKTKKGFTLIELIVVIAIIGILAAVLLPRFAGFTDKARERSAMSEAKSVYTAIETYYAEKGTYPPDVKQLENVKKEILDNVVFTSPGNDASFTYAPKNGKKIITTITCDKDGNLTSTAGAKKEE